MPKSIKETNFSIIDVISWKKSTAFPNTCSKNKATRICEFIFVFCRKNEKITAKSNKKVVSTRKTGQKMYSIFYNFIEAKNNDGSNPYNKATFSSQLVQKLLQMYVEDNSIVYDCFGGICTTAIGCIKENRNISCIISEISKNQCEYAKQRIKECEEKK